MKEKYNINFYLIMYFIGYSFYSHQIYTQILYPHFGLEIVIPFLIGYILIPIFFFYIFKKLKYKLGFKLNFIYKLLSITYLLITSILIINYASSMVHNYYYQDTSSVIVGIFFLLPVLYVSIKNSNVYYSLIFLIVLIFIGFKMLYGLNPNTYDLYPLSNTINISSYWQISLLAIPIVLEPLVLISNNEMLTEKINYKVVIPFMISISLISIFSLLRQISEFGLLVETLSFPYYESCKLVTFDSNFDNIDYYYLFSISTSIFARIPILFFTIKDSYNLKNKYMLILFILIIALLYFLVKKLEFYQLIILPTLYICSFILIILFTLSLFIKEKKHES